MDVRRCAKCRRKLPIDAFEFIDAAKDGRRYLTCEECRTKRYKREHEDVFVNPRNYKVCKKCGETKPILAFLPGFDHCRDCQRKRRTEGGREQG